MPYVIGADIGTQGTKTALLDERGKIVASSFHPSVLYKRAGGHVEQDPEEMFASVVLGIQAVMQQSGVSANRIAAISLDGQMAGIIGIDEDWGPVTPYDSWLDTRCEAYMPMVRSWGEEDIVRITGCPVTYSHGPKILWWRHERPDVYKRIRKFVVPSAYIAGKLAGLRAEQAYIDHTHLHFTGFAHTSEGEWSGELLKAFSIEAEQMPRIVSPWETIGCLTETYARETGLMTGTPIVAGCGDTAAATLGAGIVRPGQLFDVAGTASVLSCCVDAYTPDTAGKTLIYARSVLPGLWTPLAYINGGGQCLSWFRDHWGHPEEGGRLGYADLNSSAEAVAAGCGGLLFVPHFGGRVCPNNPDLRGAWLGMEWAHERGALYRSILESIAYEYHSYLRTLTGLAGEVAYTGVRVVGGGAKSALFNRIKADVLGIPYETLKVKDTALIANAVIAGYAVGLYPDMAAAAERMAIPDTAFSPDYSAHLLYAKHAARYRTAIECLTELYRNLK